MLFRIELGLSENVRRNVCIPVPGRRPGTPSPRLLPSPPPPPGSDVVGSIRSPICVLGDATSADGDADLATKEETIEEAANALRGGCRGDNVL